MDLTKPDVIRQCLKVFLVGRSLYVMGLIRFCGDKQPRWTGRCVFLWQCSVRRGRKARLRIQLPQFIDPRWLAGRL